MIENIPGNDIVDQILKKEEDIRKQLEGMSGDSLPINMDDVVGNYVDVEFKDTLDKAKTKEERERMRKAFVEHYITGPGKQFITQIVQKIQEAYQMILNAIDNLKASLTSLMSSFALPSVISVPPSTSNPAWVLLDTMGKVKVISSIVDQASGALITLYTVCLLVHLNVPDAILYVSAGIAGVKALIETVVQMIPS